MDGIGVAYGKHTSEAQGSSLFSPFHSEETEVNALASDTVWMFTCVIEEDMGQLIEQCTLRQRNGLSKLYFGKPKLGLCFFFSSSILQSCLQGQDPMSSRQKLLRSRFTVYGNKYVYWQCRSGDGCYWRRKKNTTALKDYSCDNVLLCLDTCLTALCESFAAIAYFLTDWYFKCAARWSVSPKMQFPHLDSP